MKYKALVLDLDGTTLPPFTYEVRPKIKAAIEKAKEKVFVSIATGRPLTKAVKIIEDLSLSGVCIVNNGTQLYDPIKKEIIRAYYLPRDLVEEVYALFQKEKITIWVVTDEGDFPGEKWRSYDKLYGVVAVNIPPALVPTLEEKVKHIQGITTHRMFGNTPDQEFLEVTDARATKQSGIFEVAKREGIKPEEIIGVGDSYNDFPLLMACGLKIAMGNAAPELKAIADFIAPTVEEDGVATIIEKFILQ